MPTFDVRFVSLDEFGHVIHHVFFLSRLLSQFAHRLTGWNAMQHRAQFLGLKVSDDQIRAATSMIKNLADEQDIALEHVDAILNKLDVHGSDTSSSQLMTMATTISDASLSVRLATKQSTSVPLPHAGDNAMQPAQSRATAVCSYRPAAAPTLGANTALRSACFVPVPLS